MRLRKRSGSDPRRSQLESRKSSGSKIRRAVREALDQFFFRTSLQDPETAYDFLVPVHRGG